MIKNENYIQISGWMINELKLKGTELLIYALIYGFSQDGKSAFSGSISYIMEWTNSSNRTVISALQSLCEKKLIQKKLSSSKGCVESYKYFAVRNIQNEAENQNSTSEKTSLAETSTDENFSSVTSENSSSYECKNFTRTSENSSLNNTRDKLGLKNSPSSKAADENESQIKQTETQDSENSEEEAEKIILKKITGLFSGKNPFSQNFVPCLKTLFQQFDISGDTISDYLDYVYKKTSEKKPESFTNFFYKFAQSPSSASDFLITHEKTQKEKSRQTATCPICGNMADIFGICKCGFNMQDRNNKKIVALQRQIYLLEPQEKAALETELSVFYEKKTVNFIRILHNPGLKNIFETEEEKIYKKYGVIT